MLKYITKRNVGTHIGTDVKVGFADMATDMGHVGAHVGTDIGHAQGVEEQLETVGLHVGTDVGDSHKDAGTLAKCRFACRCRCR